MKNPFEALINAPVDTSKRNFNLSVPVAAASLVLTATGCIKVGSIVETGDLDGDKPYYKGDCDVPKGLHTVTRITSLDNGDKLEPAVELDDVCVVKTSKVREVQ